MSNRRAKLAAGATVLGLGALGGIALNSNQGIPVSGSHAAPGGASSIVTGASGTAAAATSQPVAVREGATTRPPIVTRASGSGSAGVVPVDD